MKTRHHEPVKAKEPIRIRTKELRNGNKSIFLDYYHNGTRQREYLHLYLTPEVTASDRMKNEETMRTAQAVKAQRIVALQNSASGFSSARTRGKVNFVAYMERIAQKMDDEGGTSRGASIRLAIKHIRQYRGDRVTLQQVDKTYLLGFVQYLKKSGLLPSTQALYWNVIVASLNRAEREDRITENPVRKMEVADKPKARYREREYLILDEVRKLADTPFRYKYHDIKPAFLFACFCGLRLSDIRRLRWGDIVPTEDGGKQIAITQKKTGNPVYIPLSINALKWLPKRGKKACALRVFELPTDNAVISHSLAPWVSEAGITKHITFHCSRHTFATLSLSYGADLYTISKLLGHTEIQTTQIYAKVVDANKRKAVEMIPSL